MTARVTTSQGGRDELEWLVATRTVGGELAAHVRSMYGYTEYAPHGLTRRELPAPQCVVIIEIGEPIRVYASGQERDWDRFEGGFVSGVDDTFTITSYRGRQSGIQLNLTPIGARLLLGIPMHHLASSIVALPELLPSAAKLAAQLRDDTSWEARFDRVERLFM